MGACELYRALTDRGIALRCVGEQLLASPRYALTPEDAAAITLHKPGLLEMTRYFAALAGHRVVPHCLGCGEPLAGSHQACGLCTPCLQGGKWEPICSWEG